jgi:hypothetical protein
MPINPSSPRYPEVDTSLLFGSPNPNSPGYPEIDVALLPGVPNAGRPIAYKHTQIATANTWTITHNLNFLPNVTVFDSAGNMVEGSVTHTNSKSLTIAFSSPISGYAALS